MALRRPLSAMRPARPAGIRWTGMTIRQAPTLWFIRMTGRGTTGPTTPGESTPAAAIGRAISGRRSDGSGAEGNTVALTALSERKLLKKEQYSAARDRGAAAAT